MAMAMAMEEELQQLGAKQKQQQQQPPTIYHSNDVNDEIDPDLSAPHPQRPNPIPNSICAALLNNSPVHALGKNVLTLTPSILHLSIEQILI